MKILPKLLIVGALIQAQSSFAEAVKPVYVSAYLDVCVSAVFSGANAQGMTERITQILGQPSVLPEQYRRFAPDKSLKTWQLRQGDEVAVVAQPSGEASCNVSLISGNPGQAIGFYEDFVDTMNAQKLPVEHDHVQEVIDDSGQRTHWVRLVAWSIPGTEGGAALATLTVPAAGNNESVIGVLGLQLVRASIFRE